MAATRSMKKLSVRKRRGIRVRKKIFGTAERPRLSVFRSAKHIYAQVIDDEQGKTLAAASSVSKGVSTEGSKKEVAAAVGKALADKCKELNIAEVSFDRNGFRYHGRVSAVADGAREGGLKF